MSPATIKSSSAPKPNVAHTLVGSLLTGAAASLPEVRTLARVARASSVLAESTRWLPGAVVVKDATPGAKSPGTATLTQHVAPSLQALLLAAQHCAPQTPSQPAHVPPFTVALQQVPLTFEALYVLCPAVIATTRRRLTCVDSCAKQVLQQPPAPLRRLWRGARVCRAVPAMRQVPLCWYVSGHTRSLLVCCGGGSALISLTMHVWTLTECTPGDSMCKRNSGIGVGPLTMHTRTCGLGAGAFLLVHSSATVLVRGKWAAYHPSPYVDRHGEQVASATCATQRRIVVALRAPIRICLHLQAWRACLSQFVRMSASCVAAVST